MIKKTNSNPWVRLRVLLMLPALALSVVLSSACKSDIPESESQDVTKVSITYDSGQKATGEVTYNVVEPKAEEEDAFAIVEQMPEYPGGEKAMFEYLMANLKYPQSCLDDKIQGRVLVTFVVEKDGSITDTEVVKSVNPDLDAEALRVVKGMPAWTPGKQKGQEVRVRFTIPVIFKL